MLLHPSKKFENNNKKPWGVSFGDTFKNDRFKIAFESYYGQGINSTGTLSLPSANHSKEMGAYLTIDYKLSNDRTLTFGHGFAKTSDKSSTSTNSNTYTNLGLRRNQVTRVAFSQIIDDVNYYIENSYFNSKYESSYNAIGTEIGLILKF